MSFIVNQTSFNLDINMDDNVTVKSYSHKYTVLYENSSLKNIVNNNYSENDFILIDNNVYKLDTTSIENIDKKYIFFLEAIEENKTIDTVLKIIDTLLSIQFTKKNKLLVIGGGITQDIGGMTCALYKRGLNWTFIPTTMLSMTDSAIGGKVGINRNNKNVLALFVAPHKIIISEYFFNSLKREDIVSGLGESLKLSLTGGEKCLNLFIEYLKNEDYISIIKMTTSIKKIIVEHDELEKNERRVLNYGHTIGHALETATSYAIPHGIAVLYGMLIKNELFYNNKYNKLNAYIYELIPDKFKGVEINYATFLSSMLNDKKNEGNNVCFVLLKEVGESIFVFKKLESIENELRVLLRNYFTFL
jgi:3-dehydroquinate synthase